MSNNCPYVSEQESSQNQFILQTVSILRCFLPKNEKMQQKNCKPQFENQHKIWITKHRNVLRKTQKDLKQAGFWSISCAWSDSDDGANHWKKKQFSGKKDESSLLVLELSIMVFEESTAVWVFSLPSDVFVQIWSSVWSNLGLERKEFGRLKSIVGYKNEN